MAIVHVLAKVSNLAVGADDHGGRVRERRVCLVDETPRRDDREIFVGQELELDALPGCVGRESCGRLGADRPNLGPELLERLEVILQLTELLTAERSPQSAIEDQHSGAVDSGQRAKAPVGRGELQGRSGRAHLQRLRTG